MAIALIEDAEARGELQAGQTVIEATSGNTGIALAMVCAAKGYPFVAVMVESFSVERRRIMRMLGAKVILTPAAERGQGMVRKARELAEKHGWHLARQFDSPANPAYHRNTTAAEILSDFAGRRLDYFVSGWGTGGTLTGVGEMLRLARPETQIIAAEPENAALLSGKPFTPHKIQGWTPDFLPAVLNREVAHRIVTVSDADAIAQARALASREGIFCGISSGCDRRGRAEGCRGCAAGRSDPGDAAGHGRTLSLHTPCLKESVTVAIRSPELSRPADSSGSDTSTVFDARHFAAMPDPFPLWRGGNVARGAHCLRDLG